MKELEQVILDAIRDGTFEEVQRKYNPKDVAIAMMNLGMTSTGE